MVEYDFEWDQEDVFLWDSTELPLFWFSCRQCYGYGFDPLGTPCEACAGSGIRRPWRWWVWAWRDVMAFYWRLRVMEWVFARCPECGRWLYWCGLRVGDHGECLPF